jgi:glycosyltransferase involved in cell wall biosynthesis
MNALTLPKGFQGMVVTTPKPIILDVTRLLSRAHHPTPTGIDRVEFSWAHHLLHQVERRVLFQAWVPMFGRRQFSKPEVLAYLRHLELRWQGRSIGNDRSAVARLLSGSSRAEKGGGHVCLSLSHQKLHLAGKVALSRPEGGKLVIFIHDAIPSDFPEYARDGGSNRHDLRIENSFEYADMIVVNSEATKLSLQRFAERSAKSRPIYVAPLGIHPIPDITPKSDPLSRPYFLCLGTIEPRKNHLLLLHIWRRMAETMPEIDIPQLVLVGRRGWENENIIDMLDRSPRLKGLVIEKGRADDKELTGLLAGARALLMPSFVEGYGLPVAEALAARVPVIASDLDVFREIAGSVPDYIDPLDGPKWLSTILNFAATDSPERAAQLDRLTDWSPPKWEDHFDLVLSQLDRL